MKAELSGRLVNQDFMKVGTFRFTNYCNNFAECLGSNDLNGSRTVP